MDEDDGASVVPPGIKVEYDSDSEESGRGRPAKRTTGATAKRARDPEGNQREVRTIAMILCLVVVLRSKSRVSSSSVCIACFFLVCIYHCYFAAQLAGEIPRGTGERFVRFVYIYN